MSRARVVCSKILNRLSTGNLFEQLPVVSDQELIGKLNNHNLNKSREQSLLAGNLLSVTLCSNTLDSEMSGGCESQEDECKTMVDSWLDKSNIAMDESCDGFLHGGSLELRQISAKSDDSSITSDNLVLDNSVDPLLNVSSEVNGLSFPSGGNVKDLSVSDCDSSIYKNKMWDTLSIASRKSDSDKNSDFIDFNLLPYSFDPNYLIESVNEKMIGTNTVTYEFEPDATFDNILIQDNNKLSFDSCKPIKVSNAGKTNKLHSTKIKNECESDPLLIIPSSGTEKNMNVDEVYGNASVVDEKEEEENAAMFEMEETELLSQDKDTSDSDMNISSEELTSAIEPLLKEGRERENESLAAEEERVMKQHRISELANMVGLVAVVSNVTATGTQAHKGKARTRMLIKTEKGDERYEGNTADLMMPLSSRKRDRKPAPPSPGRHVIVSVETAATISEGPHTPCYRREPEDRVLAQMLAVLGIGDDMLYTVLTSQMMRVWICPEHECRRIYNRLHALKTHVLSHYGLKPFKCDHDNCPWSFYTSFKLKRHRETHSPKRKSFACAAVGCGRTFTTVYNLRAHAKLHERPARLKCLVASCHEHFQTARAMERHLKTHVEGDSDVERLAPYRCEYADCRKPCYSPSALVAHARCHSHRPEELRCAWAGCGRVFDKPCRLKAHVRQHTGDRPYACHYSGCHWAFASSSKLRRHQHKHIGERRFRCTIGDCTKAFMRSEHLRDHTLTHIGPGHRSNAFRCPRCDRQFGAKSALQVHKKKCTVVAATTEPDPLLQPNSPSVLLPCGDDYGLDSFKQEFSSLESIEPVQDKENGERRDTKVARTKRSRSSRAAESCARTYLAYHSNEMVLDEKSVPVLTSAPATDSRTNTPSCETLVNYDHFQESTQQPPVLFSNFILQDADSGADLFAAEDHGELVLLLEPDRVVTPLSPITAAPDITTTTAEGAVHSTVNLRDLD